MNTKANDTNTTQPAAQKGGTDFLELLPELHAGVLIGKLNRAISNVAEGVVYSETGKVKGTVVLELTIEQIGDTKQVRMKHKVSYTQPTARGKKSETDTSETPLHCGARGRLTAYPEKQEALFAAPPRGED